MVAAPAPVRKLKISDRRKANYIAASLYLVSVVFLLLVVVGNVDGSSPVLREVWFFKLDVSDIIPLSVENAVLLNSVARSLGLHDFYQVGLWNFCEGYNDEGITFCSEPRRFFWFNPVEVLTSELLAGARIALPAQVLQVLDLLKLGQQAMFGFFLASLCLNFFLLCAATPLVPRSRWWSAPTAFLAVLSALMATAATILASVLSIAAKVALTQQSELNIRAVVGRPMFAFMWIGALCTDAAALFELGMMCFCRPGRRRAGEGEGEGEGGAGEGAVEEERKTEGGAGGDGEGTTTGQARRPVAEVVREKVPEFVKRRKRGEAA